MTEILDTFGKLLVIAGGGGLVQLVMYFLKKKTEMRTADSAAKKVDIEADAVVVASAEKSIQLADHARDRAVKHVEMLMADLKHTEDELAEQRVINRDLRITLATRDRENARLLQAVAAQDEATRPEL